LTTKKSDTVDASAGLSQMNQIVRLNQMIPFLTSNSATKCAYQIEMTETIIKKPQHDAQNKEES
jgi:hypothetical protein